MKTRVNDTIKRGCISLMILTLTTLCSGVENQILSVSPNFAYQGQTGVMVTMTLDTDSPPAPPSAVNPSSVTIGALSGMSVDHASQYAVTAVFDISAGESVGDKDVVVVFTTPQGDLNFTLAGGFSVLVGVDVSPGITQPPQSQAVLEGDPATFSVVAWGTEPLSYQWYRDDVDIPGATDAWLTIDAVTQNDVGNYSCIVTNDFGSVVSEAASLTMITNPPYEGYNLFAPLSSTETYLMDNDCNIVKTWTSSYRPGHSAYLLEDSTLLRAANTNDDSFDVGGAGGRVEQYDWDNNLIWSYDYSTADYRQHHDIERLPNGNVLMIAWEYKSQADIIAAGGDLTVLSAGELWPDHIIEVQPTGASGGMIVWEWHVWDHLIQDYDASKDNYGVVADHPEKINLNYAINYNADWNHINSVDYNAELGQILLSVHSFSEIWIIDHNTTTVEAAGPAGDLLYRWGNPQTYGRGTSSDQQLFAQHDAEWIEAGLPGEGDILIFNNGVTRPGGGSSSVDQITPPLDGSNYTLQQGSAYEPAGLAWTYPETLNTSFFAQNISGSQRLANGDTLICDGPDGHFFEVDSEGVVVWEYNYGSNVFRVERYGNDYPGFVGTELEPEPLPESGYPIVDTGQVKCYNNNSEISPPVLGGAFNGQDAQINGNQPSYTDNGDGTVTDNVTGLMWQKSADLNGDGEINADDKLTYDQAVAGVSGFNLAGYTDWRLPSIKEAYSLILFSGEDVSGYMGTTGEGIEPFIDDDYFGFGYGDVEAGERLLEGQMASATKYVTTTRGEETMFGVNFVDGRIKGYGLETSYGGGPKVFYVMYVRGNTSYGINNFEDNSDGTVSDKSTGLMWSQDDSGFGVTWEDALALVEIRNSENYLGYSDWRLPNAKELQSLIDYTRSPVTTNSAAIDPKFNCTKITNEAGETDYPYYWTGTTHASWNVNHAGESAVYLSFGRAMGYMDNKWTDVHGAGAQRSDPKTGDPANYPTGFGPQGDAIRIYNYVRLVRDTQCGEPGYISGLDSDLQ